MIANELKDLSLQTDDMSRQVRARVAGIAAALGAAHQRLRDVAAARVSGDGREMRGRLDAVLNGLLAQNQAMTAVLDQTAAAADEIATTVAHLVTGAQFQDRASQHLGHVSDALATMRNIAGGLRDDTNAMVPALRAHDGLDQALIERLVRQQRLSAMRHRFLDNLVGTEAAAGVASHYAAGDVELF